MTNRETFRKNLTRLMQESKVKQIDIAKYAGVSYQTVSAWVTGRGYPRAEAMEQLCRFFNITQSALTEDRTENSDEENLLNIFRALSETGREKLLERSRELLQLYPCGRKKD